MRDFGFITLLIICAVFLLAILEIYVILVVSGFLASFFGFSGILWWVCAFMVFCFINGVIGAIWLR